MKYKVDELEKQAQNQANYIENIRKVLQGGPTAVSLDTTQLAVPKDDISND